MAALSLKNNHPHIHYPLSYIYKVGSQWQDAMYSGTMPAGLLVPRQSAGIAHTLHHITWIRCKGTWTPLLGASENHGLRLGGADSHPQPFYTRLQTTPCACWRSCYVEAKRTASSAKSRDVILRFLKWTPSQLWLESLLFTNLKIKQQKFLWGYS